MILIASKDFLKFKVIDKQSKVYATFKAFGYKDLKVSLKVELVSKDDLIEIADKFDVALNMMIKRYSVDNGLIEKLQELDGISQLKVDGKHLVNVVDVENMIKEYSK